MASFLGLYKGEYKPNEALVRSVKQRAVTENFISYIDVRLVEATAASLAGYGRLIASREEFDAGAVQLVQWPSPCGRPVINGAAAGATPPSAFSCAWSRPDCGADDDRLRSPVCAALHHDAADFDMCTVRNEAVSGRYVIGVRVNGGRDIVLSDANAHPDGEQHFWPVTDAPFIMVLSKHADEATISPLHFVAFHFDGSRGVALHAGTYHKAAFPAGGERALLLTKQGKVHGRVVVDSLAECQVLMRIKDYVAAPASDAAAEPESAEHCGANAAPCVPAGDSATAEPFGSHSLHVADATAASLKAYGIELVEEAAAKADSFPIVMEQWPSKERPMFLGDEAGTTIEQFDAHAASPVQHITQLHRRMDSSQLIWPADARPWLIVVADSRPPLHRPVAGTLAALRVPPAAGLHVPSAVWLAPDVAVTEPTEPAAMRRKVGAANAVEVFHVGCDQPQVGRGDVIEVTLSP